MAESSHDLVAAREQRIWEIVRVVRPRRDRAVESTVRPPESDGYLTRFWNN
jgi:hypothetical protein